MTRPIQRSLLLLLHLGFEFAVISTGEINGPKDPKIVARIVPNEVRRVRKGHELIFFIDIVRVLDSVLPQPELEDRPDRVNFNLRVNRDEKGTASFFGQ